MDWRQPSDLPRIDAAQVKREDDERRQRYLGWYAATLKGGDYCRTWVEVADLMGASRQSVARWVHVYRDSTPVQLEDLGRYIEAVWAGGYDPKRRVVLVDPCGLNGDGA